MKIIIGAILDSIALLIQGGRTDLNMEYRSRAEAYTQQHQEMTEQYTADIWKTINSGVLEFGKPMAMTISSALQGMEV